MVEKDLIPDAAMPWNMRRYPIILVNRLKPGGRL